ncbi:MAG: hypothetical protein KGH66_01230 [Candidatus Micrarchaeota archaeon]|nr:hypothetical protein [Candidatus Micrarchaeota archaeon]
MRPRAQTTMEFMILLGASASLGIAALAMYGHLTSSQSTILASIANSSGAQAPAQFKPAGNQSSMLISLGGTSYLNSSNSFYVVISAPYGAYIAGVNLSAEGGSVAPSSYGGMASDGMKILQFAFLPTSEGSSLVSAEAEVEYNGSDFELQKTAYTYSVPLQGPAVLGQGPQFSASITPLNQSILYPISTPSNVTYATEWSHCSYHDFFNHLLPFQAQCGNANWEFFVFSDSCYWGSGVTSATYCITLNSTHSSYSTISQAQSYQYAARVGIYNQTMSLVSYINSSSNHSILVGALSAAGTASVSSVSGIGPNPQQGYVILNVSGRQRAIGTSSYGSYIQALNNIDSVLGYYNQTGIEDSDLSVIQAAIQGYNTQSLQFTNSSNQTDPQCSLYSKAGKQFYKCSPVSGLYYVIDASISGAKATQTLSVGGSTININ